MYAQLAAYWLWALTDKSSTTQRFRFSALVASGLLYVIVPYESHGLLGMTQVKPVSPLVAFGVELLMTFTVTLTVLTCTDGGHRTVDHSSSVVIGLAVTACHFFGVIILLICTFGIWFCNAVNPQVISLRILDMGPQPRQNMKLDMIFYTPFQT